MTVGGRIGTRRIRSVKSERTSISTSVPRARLFGLMIDESDTPIPIRERCGRTDAFKSMMNIQVWKVLAGGREGFGRPVV